MTVSTTVAPPASPEAVGSAHKMYWVAPGLSGLCATAGLAAWTVNAIAIPSFAQANDPVTWAWIARAGGFLSLLYALSGMVALPLSLAFPPAAALATALKKPFMVPGLAAGLLYIVGRAAFLERQYTGSQHVFVALGTAHLLGFSVSTAALVRCRDPILRLALIGAVLVSLCGLGGQLLDVLVRIELTSVRLQLGRAVHSVGEAGYLLLVGSVSLRLWRFQKDGHRRLLGLLSLGLLGMSSAAMGLLWNHLGAAFGLVLYHAQRVRLLLDSAPLLYVLPICATVGTGLAGLASPDSRHRQLAIAALLLIAAGYSPRAPGPLLLVTLGLVLLVRTAIGPDEPTPAPGS